MGNRKKCQNQIEFQVFFPPVTVKRLNPEGNEKKKNASKPFRHRTKCERKREIGKCRQ